MITKTRGIVLNYIKYGDTSIICKIYTEQFGLQSYIINGIRNSKSKNIGLFHYEECMRLIRDYDIQKKKMLTEYYSLISSSLQFKILSPFYTKQHGRINHKLFEENTNIFKNNK